MRIKYFYRNNKEFIKDQFAFFIGTILAYLTTFPAVKYLNEAGLWVSLAITITIAIYFSVTFFSTNNKAQKLYFYFWTMFFIAGYFALLFKVLGAVNVDDAKLVKIDWLDAFYLSFATWTTLGYSDLRPPDSLKLWVIVETVMGYVSMGLLIGMLVVYFQDIGESVKLKSRKRPTLAQKKRRISYSKKH